MPNAKSKRANAPRLEEFRKEHPSGSRIGKWSDSLPDDIVAEIMASSAGARVTTLWLLDLGFEGATESKVEALLIVRRQQARDND